MEKKFLKLWELAKPYYEKGRVYDIEQVEWMVKGAEKLVDVIGVDGKILFPLIILHDVGYSAVGNKNPHIKDKDTKRLHMAEGAKIARHILEQVNYDPELTKIIVKGVSEHDNWAFGDDEPYKKSKLMALFNDLDFLFVNSSLEAFKLAADSMGMTLQEFYNFWIKDEKLTRRPFCCKETQEIWDTTIKEIKRQLDNL